MGKQNHLLRFLRFCRREAAIFLSTHNLKIVDGDHDVDDDDLGGLNGVENEDGHV